MSSTFFRGTTTDQVSYFSDKTKVALEGEWPERFKNEDALPSFKLQGVELFINEQVKVLTGSEDDIVTDFIYAQIAQSAGDGPERLVNMTMESVKSLVVTLEGLLPQGKHLAFAERLLDYILSTKDEEITEVDKGLSDRRTKLFKSLPIDRNQTEKRDFRPQQARRDRKEDFGMRNFDHGRQHRNRVQEGNYKKYQRDHRSLCRDESRDQPLPGRYRDNDDRGRSDDSREYRSSRGRGNNESSYSDRRLRYEEYDGSYADDVMYRRQPRHKAQMRRGTDTRRSYSDDDDYRREARPKTQMRRGTDTRRRSNSDDDDYRREARPKGQIRRETYKRRWSNSDDDDYRREARPKGQIRRETDTRRWSNSDDDDYRREARPKGQIMRETDTRRWSNSDDDDYRRPKMRGSDRTLRSYSEDEEPRSDDSSESRWSRRKHSNGGSANRRDEGEEVTRSRSKSKLTRSRSRSRSDQRAVESAETSRSRSGSPGYDRPNSARRSVS